MLKFKLWNSGNLPWSMYVGGGIYPKSCWKTESERNRSGSLQSLLLTGRGTGYCNCSIYLILSNFIFSFSGQTYASAKACVFLPKPLTCWKGIWSIYLRSFFQKNLSQSDLRSSSASLPARKLHWYSNTVFPKMKVRDWNWFWDLI